MDIYFNFPDIDRNFISFGDVSIFGLSRNLSIKWYSLMYIIGTVYAWFICRKRAKDCNLTKNQVDDFIFYCFLGVFFGGRIGYVLFYKFYEFIQSPLMLFKIYEGGMSFHGGIIGVTIAVFLFAKKINSSFLILADFVAPTIPIGLGLGRIGNFINGELCGRITDVPWAFIFPHVDLYPRHPSQLYQSFLEGVALFFILHFFRKRSDLNNGEVMGVFLFFYGLFRFLVEFVREPDSHIGLYLNFFSHGQLLSFPMIFIGLFFILRKRVAFNFLRS